MFDNGGSIIDTPHSLLVEHVSKSYPTATGPLTVLHDVCFELRAGDSLAIVGPSGSGKSTLLQILGTLDHPDDGTITIDQDDPFKLNEKDLAAFRNQKIGFVFQDHHLLPQLTVIENVLVAALAIGQPNAEQIERCESLLAAVSLADRRWHLPGELSGGERERVAIARALLMQPALILADEPTGNLDRRTADSVTELLLTLPSDFGVILVAVTHSDALAASMKKRMELEDGRLV